MTLLFCVLSEGITKVTVKKTENKQHIKWEVEEDKIQSLSIMMKHLIYHRKCDFLKEVQIYYPNKNTKK